MYFDIRQRIETDFLKIEAITQHDKGAGVLIAMDSNFRSTSWHDTLPNTRGRILEEFLMSKQLYIMNKESDYTTYQSHRGTSNIDLTVISDQLLRTVVDWEISEQESCSDHSIIRYARGQSKGNRTELDSQYVRYIVQKGTKQKFQGNLLRSAEKMLCKVKKEGGTEGLDKTLCTRVSDSMDIEELIEEFHDVMISACNESFRTQRASKKAVSNKSIPWWTEELTIMRKRVNALRRRYQRARSSEELREQRKITFRRESKVRSNS